MLQSVLLKELRLDPTRTQQQLCVSLQHYGVFVSRDFVQRACQRLQVSYKNVAHRHQHRFELHNIIYYCDFLCWVRSVPWMTLKFTDEASFESRSKLACSAAVIFTCARAGLLRAKGFAERNRRLEVKLDRAQWGAATFSVFLLTSLSSDNGVYVSNPAFGNNTAENFLNWVEECIVTRVSCSTAVRCSSCALCLLQNLVRGDTLVCDNSKLHHAKEIVRDFHSLLDANGIRLVYMPKYAPELSPCELCFGRAKRYLRDERGEGEFVVEVAQGFARIDAPMVCSFYKKCIIDV